MRVTPDLNCIRHLYFGPTFPLFPLRSHLTLASPPTRGRVEYADMSIKLASSYAQITILRGTSWSDLAAFEAIPHFKQSHRNASSAARQSSCAASGMRLASGFRLVIPLGNGLR
jgi:hypothetical protein